MNLSSLTLLGAVSDVTDANSVTSGTERMHKRVEKHARDVLWKKTRFTSAATCKYKVGGIYTKAVKDLKLTKDMGEDKWRKYEALIRRSLNNKRNNTVDAMKKAFEGKCTAG